MSDFVEDFFDNAWSSYMSRPDAQVSDYTITSIVKEYPQMLQIIVYRDPVHIHPSGSRLGKRNLSDHERLQINAHRSLRRTKSTISDYIMSNNFELWCTFTFDPKKYDRFNTGRCKLVMSNWLHNQKKHSPKLKYLIVPELHKRCYECVTAHLKDCLHPDRPKALHFHALLSNFNGSLKPTKLRTAKGQTIYNASGYRAGFSEIVKLHELPNQNLEALSNYMTKQYLTKDMITFSGKKRYWASHNLVSPSVTVNGLDLFRLKTHIWKKPPTYSTEFFEVFHIPKHKTANLTTTETQLRIQLDMLAV